MARFMSVALTEQAVRERRKTVTRRIGWRFLRPGDRLTLVRKSMGRRRADGTVEQLVRLADVVVTSVTREPLHAITKADVAREGFPGWSPAQFVGFFVSSHRGCSPSSEITRIEWRYIDEQAG
jgi:hypothetical protein